MESVWWGKVGANVLVLVKELVERWVSYIM